LSAEKEAESLFGCAAAPGIQVQEFPGPLFKKELVGARFLCRRAIPC
jgi:hypothetical protein